MRSAGYVVLFAAFGCTQGMCRSGACGARGAPPDVRPPPSATSAPPDLPAPNDGEQDALRDRIDPLRRGGRTVVAEPPSDAEERSFHAWVAAAARAAAEGQPPPMSAPAGFTLQVVPGRPLWLLCEGDGRRRGGGVVVLRVGRAAPLLVEAPHTFFDQGTLPIALAVFEAQRARALLVNTSHRYGGLTKAEAMGEPPKDAAGADAGATAKPAADGDDGDDEPPKPAEAGRKPIARLLFADVAHAERSFFLTAHRALLESSPRIPTVQLHGFGDGSAPGASAIAAAHGDGADLERLLGPLRAATPDGKVLAYPADIRKLGGESNVEGRASRDAGAPFYHVEVSRSLRDQLVKDPALRRRFAAAFSGIAAPAPAAP